MHEQLLTYLQSKRPQLETNPNINLLEEDALPVPEKTARSQVSWIRSSVTSRGGMVPSPTLD